MREIVVFFDQPAEPVIAGAAAFVEARGLRVTNRTPYSVSFAGDAPSAGDTPSNGGVEIDPTLQERRRDDPGELPVGTGQCSAVPVQLRPEWCRVWVTVNDTGAVSAAAEAYIETHREHSRVVEAAVRALEADIYSEARWPAYEMTLRASLGRAGTDPVMIDEKVAAFKQRWLGLGRRAAKAPPEEHLSA